METLADILNGQHAPWPIMHSDSQEIYCFSTWLWNIGRESRTQENTKLEMYST